MLHIGDITAEKLVRDGVKRAGLIGTRVTMSEPFYRERIEADGIEVTVPDAAMARETERIIFEELTRGTVSRGSTRHFKHHRPIEEQGRTEAVLICCTSKEKKVYPGRDR